MLRDTNLLEKQLNQTIRLPTLGTAPIISASSSNEDQLVTKDSGSLFEWTAPITPSPVTLSLASKKVQPWNSVVVFRNDLRLDDHPAFAHAVAAGPVLPVFISDPTEERGSAYLWWQHQSLRVLEGELRHLGLPLVYRRGETGAILHDILTTCQLNAVYWNRRYIRDQQQRDDTIKRDLEANGWHVKSFIGDLLGEPELFNQGRPSKVFTPFWNRFQCTVLVDHPLDRPKTALRTELTPYSDNPDHWGWEPTRPDWAAGLRKYWEPGELGARVTLETFIKQRLVDYSEGRDYPATNKVSRLSPHLAHGEISPRRIWRRLHDEVSAHPDLRPGVDKFLQELGWREFSWHLLWHFPDMLHRPLRPQFLKFPWQYNPQMLKAWQKGRTGFPIVDAGMRELWQTGYMHNRVRMIVASFLVKDLLLPWQDGAAWFSDTLVDADPASNSASWQWVAGSGMDAAPYFRVFNPVLQAKKFDPDGSYQRQWVPELATLPKNLVPEPWSNPNAALAAGVELGRQYPHRLVDHIKARAAALAAFATLKGIAEE